MGFKTLTQGLTFLLALNFCGQVACCHVTALEITQQIDFDQDSEKEESESEKEQDKLNERITGTQIHSQIARSLQSVYSPIWWKSPSLEISDPPPEQV